MNRKCRYAMENQGSVEKSPCIECQKMFIKDSYLSKNIKHFRKCFQ